MKCTFSCKKINLRDSIKEYTDKKLAKLDRYFRDEPSAAVTFSAVPFPWFSRIVLYIGICGSGTESGPSA